MHVCPKILFYPCLHRNDSLWIPGNVVPAAIFHLHSWIVWRLIHSIWRLIKSLWRLLNIFFMSLKRFRSSVLPFCKNVCVRFSYNKYLKWFVVWKNRTISRLSQPTVFNWFTYLPNSALSDMKDMLSVQRHVRARGEIIILNGNEMYNVPIATVLKTFLHYSGGHLRYGHGMDSCVTVWILPLCVAVTSFLTIVYSASLILKRLSSSAYSKSGNNQWL